MLHLIMIDKRAFYCAKSILICATFLMSCNNQKPINAPSSSGDPVVNPLFELLDAEQTKVYFNNVLTEGLNTNILMYEYFYNGGGVAVGDLNGDDLIDLYFTSNMGDNRLYLNQGGMVFEDITQISGASGRPGPWKTGVNIVDVNGDGLKDIYLCYSGALPDAKRQNQLFINQGLGEDGHPRFEDEAGPYGLASAAYSTQSYFFDYDRDGDLDMILLNHNPKNLPILNEVKTAELLSQDDPLRGLRVYEQNRGLFEDVTSAVGINGSPLSYGLGVGISDYNNDGWPDFYVSNDYAVPDYLYINQGDGTFINQLEKSIGHTSQFSMGNDVADINNDGYTDIITLDMLPEDNRRQKLLVAPDEYSKFDLNVRSGFYYQYMRNMLQLNNGDDTFSEIGQYAGISNTDWSWSALLADFDNDGWKDLYVTNGYKRDYTNQDFINYMDNFVEQRGRLKREDVMEIVGNMPSSDVSNYAYRGSESLVFANTSADWGLGLKANSNGAAYADLDNDGDIDLVTNNINLPAFVFENKTNQNLNHHYLKVKLESQSANTAGIGARVKLVSEGAVQVLEQYPSRGYQSSVSDVLHFGIGSATVIDTLQVRWASGMVETLINPTIDQVLVVSEDDAQGDRSIMIAGSTSDQPYFVPATSSISYRHSSRSIRDFDRQPLLLSEFSHSGPCMVKGDLNGDMFEDVFIGGEAGRPGKIFLQQASGQFLETDQPKLLEDATFEDTDAVIFDVDRDGDNDIYVTGGGYGSMSVHDENLRDRLYLNDGSGQLTLGPAPMIEDHGSTGTVVASDIDNDGDQDLYVGGMVVPGRYPEPPSSYVLLNDGHGQLIDKMDSDFSELRKIGMVTDALFVDINGDGIEDLVTVGSWMSINIFINNKGKLENRSEAYIPLGLKGFWNVIETTDLNSDGRPDFIIGNLGDNTQLSPLEDRPIVMYYSDYDNNGSVDPIMSYPLEGGLYPFATRDELQKQLPKYRSIFTSYESYATATIDDVLSQEDQRRSTMLNVETTQSVLLMSTASGRYRVDPLPAEAQYAPIHTVNVMDVDGDGLEDLLLCGNDRRMKLRIGQIDANHGMVFRGLGDGVFKYVDQKKAGISIAGDVRSAVQIGDQFLIGVNSGALRFYHLN